MAMKIDFGLAVLVLSDAVDLVGVDAVQHSKRVAALAMASGFAMGWDREALHDLFLASLMHDCAVSTTGEYNRLMTEFAAKDADSHCMRGFEILRRFSPFERAAGIVRYHHESWGEHPVADSAPLTALMSNAVFLADRVDMFVQLGPAGSFIRERAGLLDMLERMEGDYFAPALLEAFKSVSEKDALWLTLEAHHLERHLLRVLERLGEHTITFDQFHDLADIFATIVDSKSPYTSGHSQGVARLSRFLGECAGLSPEDCEYLEISGLLHDLGRLRVPDEIMEKEGPLDRIELAEVKRGAFETYQILSRLPGMNGLARWASYHYEPVLPPREGAPQTTIQPAIVAAADTYQSLTQPRPYRGSLDPDALVETVQKMGVHGKLHPEVVELVVSHSEECWRLAKGLQPAAVS